MFQPTEIGSGDASQYRIFYQDGHISHHDTSSAAMKELHGLSPSYKVAVRGKGDSRSVVSTDYHNRQGE